MEHTTYLSERLHMTVGSDRETARPMLSTEILEKVRLRDPEALGRLFDGYFHRIFNLAYRFTGDRTAAEDLTQEVFLRIYKGAHQLEASRDPGPWIMTITANLCREKWKSKAGKQAQKTTSLDANPEMREFLSHPQSGPDDQAVRTNQNELLEEAITRLPEAMRMIVILHDFQGLTHEEIGRILDEEAATVRKRYSRALGKLRELLPEGLR